MKTIISITITLFIISGCATSNNNALEPKEINAVDEAIYKKIYFNIKNSNLDIADDQYIKLKGDYENSTLLQDAATALAIAHIKNREHILANFYIQEGLGYKDSELLKFLLVRNQFMASQESLSDHSYIKKSLTALESNSELISSSEYKLLANSYLTRLKIQTIYDNLQTSKLYNNLGKKDAYSLYKNRALQSNIDIATIHKP